MHVLVTGGAGFIGSFLVDALIARGETVRILDNLEGQVHNGTAPAYLNPQAEFLQGDVRSTDDWVRALEGVDVVIHCASAVGVGQSQYEVKRYTDVNVGGTAILLDLIANGKTSVKRMLVPTSMTSYGEGVYRCPQHGDVRPGLRSEEQLARQDWQLHCPQCGAVTEPVPTPETAQRESGTVYSLTKNMQEEMMMNIGRTYGVPCTALRLFNVFGPRQSLSNPYTGVAAIFVSRLKNGNAPVVFEDGEQSRDFISVHDVVRAFLLALDSPAAHHQVMNIGSGEKTSILDVARTLAQLLGVSIEPVIEAKARKNDVRHCYADASKARNLLGWQPQVSFSDGMRELVEWSAGEQAVDRFDEAQREFQSKHLQA